MFALRSFVVTSVLALAMVQGNPYYKNLDEAKHPDWMSKLADDRWISELSIPGTHETMSLHGGDAVQCQEDFGSGTPGAMAMQLHAGIRMVDIRVKINAGNTFTIHHGSIYQEANFADVVLTLTQFLSANPRETVLMRLKHECNKDHIFACTDDGQMGLADIFDSYKTDIFWAPSVNRDTGADMPKLGDVRGKVVLVIMQDYFGGRVGNYGLKQMENWNDFVQDDYNVPTLFHIPAKREKVVEYLKQTAVGDYTQLIINFGSGSSLGAYPYSVANGPIGTTGVNEGVWEFINGNDIKRTGVIMMDFPGPWVIEIIIQVNDRGPHTAAQAYDYEHIPVTPNGVAWIGGSGGDYFEYHTNGGYPVKTVKVWTDGGNVIQSIYFDTTDGTSYQIGSPPQGISSNDFTFNDDEALTELVLTGNGIGTRLGSIHWKTSANREFNVGIRQTDYVFNTKNSILMGFWGNHGLDIDALGVFLMKPIKESKLVVLDYPEWNDAAVNDGSKMFALEFDYTNEVTNGEGVYEDKFGLSFSENKQWTVTNGKETDKTITVSGTIPLIDIGVEGSFTATESQENTYQNEVFELYQIERTISVTVPACTRVTGFVTVYLNNDGIPYNGVRRLTFMDDTTLDQPIEGDRKSVV